VNEIPDGQWDNSMKSVNSFSDAVLVGNSLREEMLEQIIRYKDSGLVTKPMIASQGVNAGSLENIFKYADGVIMGSAFRDKGNVSLDKIKQVKEIQQQSI